VWIALFLVVPAGFVRRRAAELRLLMSVNGRARNQQGFSDTENEMTIKKGVGVW